MKPAKIALMGGLGYPVTETQAGMPTLKTRLEALGATVLLTSWDARQAVYDFLKGFDGFRALCGDSLGAGSAAQYAGDQRGQIDFVGGFQPSMDDNRTNSDGTQTVAANCVRAHCIYNPSWIMTLGLGQAHWVPAHGAKTAVSNTVHYGFHPDDWGVAQDIVFNDIKGLLS